MVSCIYDFIIIVSYLNLNSVYIYIYKYVYIYIYPCIESYVRHVWNYPVILRILGCFSSSFSRKIYVTPDSLAPISQGTKNLSCDSYDIKVLKHKSKLWHILHRNLTPVIQRSKGLFWLVVSTHLKNISQIGNLPQIGMKIKHIWNHHLVLNH